MPFLSDRGERSFEQEFAPIQLFEESGFYETLGAAFQLTVDEELSISAMRNREMFEERNQNVRSLINDGVIDRDKYSDPRGRFDYDRLSRDLEDTEFSGLIKNSRTLRDERNEMLRIRRERNEKVIERGSGLAQFLGMGGGLLLDPVNLASVGGGLFITAARSGTVLGRALYGLKTEAGLAAASEAAIQPLVFYHKNDIDSPYSVGDALTNIAVASTFSGALGFGFGGIAGYFGRAAEKSREGFVNSLPDKPIEVETGNIAFIEAVSPSSRSIARPITPADPSFSVIETGPDGKQTIVQKRTEELTAEQIQEMIDAGEDASFFENFSPPTDPTGTGQGRTSVKTTFNKNQIDEIVKRSKQNRERLTEAQILKRNQIEEIQDQYDIGMIDSAEKSRKIDDANALVREIQEEIEKDDIILDAIMDASGSKIFRAGIEKIRHFSRLVESFVVERPDTANNILAKELDEFLEQDVEQQLANIPKLIERLNKKKEPLQKPSELMKAWVISIGGLNRKDFQAMSNFDDEVFNSRTNGLGVGFWRSGDDGKTVDGLIEALGEDGTLAYNFRYEEGIQPQLTDEAIAFVEAIVANPRLVKSDDARAQLEALDREIAELERLTEEDIRQGQLQQRFQAAQEGIVAEHEAATARFLQVAENFEEDLLEPQDFLPDRDFADLDETDIEIRDAERRVLESQGLSEAHDRNMSEYARLSDEDQNVTIEIDGVERNIKDFVEQQDNDLSALNELKRCVRGV
ncbi:hypothetical protein [uncultured Mediterranean phage uvMED]|nr:hypothetical protein [uncultured Mediterranean phage uvMED]